MKVQVNDIEMTYEEHGAGIPLLLIHGFPLNRQIWEPQFAALSGSARLLAPDLRGHGGTAAPAGPYSMDRLASDLNEFLEQLGVQEQVVLCGLSMGGYVTLAFLRSFPERVSGIILASTRTPTDTEEGKQGREEMASSALQAGPSAVVDKMLPKMLAPQTYDNNPELVERLRDIMGKTPAQGMAGALIGMKDRPDSTDTLRSFQGPVLLVHGTDDQLIPPTEAEAMHAAQPNALLELVPEAGHMVNMEQPERFNQSVQRFLDSLPKR